MKKLFFYLPSLRAMLFLCAFAGSGLEGFAQLSCPLRIDSAGLTNGGFQMHISGPASSSLWLEFSTNLLHWDPLLSAIPFSGALDFVDTNYNNLNNRFYRSRILINATPPIHYFGDTVTLTQTLPECLGPGSVVYFDLNGTGTYGQNAVTDSAGMSTLILDTSDLADTNVISMYAVSADGTQRSAVTSLTLVRDGSYNPANNVPI